MLDQLENLGANVVVDRGWADGFEQRDKIVHEFFGGDLGKEMLAAVLDAGVCEVQGAQLCVWVLVTDALLEGAHGFLWRDGLGSDHVGNLEVQSYVFQATAGGLVDLFVQGGRCRG